MPAVRQTVERRLRPTTVGRDRPLPSRASVCSLGRGTGCVSHGALFGVADEGGWWPEFASDEEALASRVAAIERAGFEPGREVAIALDIAASDFGRAGRYRLDLEQRELDSDGLIDLLQRWCQRFPIASIEDPLAEDDLEAFARFTRAVAKRMQVVGDDLLVSDAASCARRPRRGRQHRAAQAQPARHAHRNGPLLASGG